MQQPERPHLRLVWSQEVPGRDPAAELRRETQRVGWIRIPSLDAIEPEPGSRIVGHHFGAGLELYYVPPGEPSRWTLDEIIESAWQRNRAA